MRQPKIIAVLNRALATVYRSLPIFVEEVQPWSHPGDEKAAQLLQNLVADQKQYAAKIADLILDLNGCPDAGAYPIVYTDLHLLSLDYLLLEIAEQQKRDIAVLDDCLSAAQGDVRAAALLAEVLGNARGHLESLEQSQGQSAN
ncbi:MAG TPA: hypothetical protein VFE24_13295 [Pirellulales bacterium]|jgi:bacterioferritin (cytochrome b1)|nr:hypothetical protein [Pirellulales bacterium]